ncbi:MAG: SagB/ThcOx family dehydrogenase [Pseudomonadota bacterium]
MAKSRVELPQAAPPPADLWRTLAGRRSHREYSDQALNLGQVAALLWAAQGVTKPGHALSLRTAPSAGARYPIEVLVAARRVEGLEAGLWRLDVASFALEAARPVDEVFFRGLERATLGQEAVKQAAAVFVFSAVAARCAENYGERSARYIALDAGHICQNLLLAAEALGLAACPLGAFVDSEINRVLGLDSSREQVWYLASVGARR